MKTVSQFENKVAETKAQWLRAYQYSQRVAVEAQKRAFFIYTKGHARKQYEKAVKEWEKAALKEIKRK